MGPVKFFYNSKFDFTTKSLVTNTVCPLYIHYALRGTDLLFVFFPAVTDSRRYCFSKTNCEGDLIDSDVMLQAQCCNTGKAWGFHGADGSAVCENCDSGIGKYRS